MQATPRVGMRLVDLLPEPPTARPSANRPDTPPDAEPLLRVEALVKEYPRSVGGSVFGRLLGSAKADTTPFRAVDGISWTVLKTSRFERLRDSLCGLAEGIDARRTGLL
jgi:peptide/nickel transport system ATP-binding protein